MKKGFFISIDLIITLAAAILLLGLLGAYLHENIQSYSEYKEDIKMQATMNIVMNRLADSNQCDLKSDNGLIIKPISFCANDFDVLFDDLDYNVAIYDIKGASFLYGDFDKDESKYIAKDMNIFYAKVIQKKDYINCFNGVNCDSTGKINVRAYVWK